MCVLAVSMINMFLCKPNKSSQEAAQHDMVYVLSGSKDVNLKFQLLFNPRWLTCQNAHIGKL